jgi:hypothetical protein
MTDLTNLRIFVCTAPIKMNLSFDGLMGLAEETFDQDPVSGRLFLFLNWTAPHSLHPHRHRAEWRGLKVFGADLRVVLYSGNRCDAPDLDAVF